MLSWTTFELLLTGVSALIAILLVFHADLTRARGGKILAFSALFLLPVIALGAGLSRQMEQSKSTQFCLSCHVMEDYGKSLLVDDKSYVPAAHYQNNRVPREQACYTCHSDYTMYGGVTAKLRGLRHVYIQYLGRIPKPAEIRLYSAFNNRECLHCHKGARSFTEAPPHQKTSELLDKIINNEKSCMSSKCHDTIHDVDTLADAKMWKAEH
jgi:nitrate/TMAO reductase-like tetraheme cytochrome c subunit